MAGESSIKLKVSVWRDFVPNKSLILHHVGENDRQIPALDSELQQEVYAWQTTEEPFDGISKEEVRLHLRDLLFDRFEASRAPSSAKMRPLTMRRLHTS